MEVTRPSPAARSCRTSPPPSMPQCSSRIEFSAGEMGHERQDCGHWGPGRSRLPTGSIAGRVTSPSRVPNSEQAGTRLRASYGQVRLRVGTPRHLSSQPFGFASRLISGEKKLQISYAKQQKLGAHSPITRISVHIPISSIEVQTKDEILFQGRIGLLRMILVSTIQ